jgi:hypothetical protein
VLSQVNEDGAILSELIVPWQAASLLQQVQAPQLHKFSVLSFFFFFFFEKQ